MYLTHFGLTGYPFERDLQPDELFASTSLREAQARLSHLVELRGIGLITGEVGSGKTTACRQFAASLHAGLYRLLYVTLSTGNVMDMYKSIAWDLGLPIERNRSMAFRAIQTEITRLATEARQQPILVIDEAHHLRNEVLEDLRLLTNYAMDSERRLCLVLVGLTTVNANCTLVQPIVRLGRNLASVSSAQGAALRSAEGATCCWCQHADPSGQYRARQFCDRSGMDRPRRAQPRPASRRLDRSA